MMMLSLACACLPAVGLSAQKKFGWDWRQAEIDADYPGGAYASDPVRRKIYRFGGNRGPSLSNETWEFDGRRWRQLHPKHSPPPLASAMMAFDPVTKTVILFGGVTQVEDRYGIVVPFKHSARTWSWDGQDWKELVPTKSPTLRYGGSNWMVSDSKNRRVILHGGFYYPGGLFPIPLNDTWVWDGLTWREIQSAQKPSLRYAIDLAYHEGDGSIVLFGGYQYPRGPFLNDTWVLRGNKWSLMPKSQVSPPSVRSSYVAFSDFITKELWLFGGEMYSSKLGKEVYLDDLWSWNGKKWKKLGSGYGKGWNLPLLQHMGSIGPLLYLDVSYYPGNTETTPRGTRTFRWQRPGWKEVARFNSSKYERDYYDHLVEDPISGSILRFSVGPKPYGGGRFGSVVDVFRLEGSGFRPVPVTGNKPEYLSWTMPRPFFDPILGKFRFFTQHVAAKDFGIWTFEGSKWTFKPLSNPGVRLPWASWDPVRKKPVYVDGQKFYGFDGSQWKVEFEDKNGPKSGYVLYDFMRKVHVLYEPWSGGTLSTPAKTWELKGQKWQLIPTKHVPPASAVGRKLTYVPDLGGILLAGGRAMNWKALAGTWLYDGKDWTKMVSLAQLPQPRVSDRMTNLVYDAARRRVLAFYAHRQPHMFELRKRTLERSEPLVKRGESTNFEIAMPQQGGSPFLLGLSLTRKKGIPIDKDPIFGTRLFPLDFDSMLAWSLGGPILTILDKGGRGKIPFRIPKDSSIPEMDLWASGFTLDLTKLKVGEVSNSIPLQIIR